VADEIEAIGDKKSSDAVAAHYAALLARGPVEVAVEVSGAGGGSLTRPDAIVLVGNRDAASQRAKQMRAQSEQMRVQSERLKTEGAQNIAKGDQMKVEGEREAGEGQRLLTDAHAVERAADGKVAAADAIQQDVQALEHEAEAASTQAEDAQRRSANIRERGEMLIRVGQGTNSESTVDAGMDLMREAGMMDGEAKILYEKSSGRSKRASEVRGNADHKRREGVSAQEAARGQVTAAQAKVSAGQRRQSDGENTRNAGDRQNGQSEDLSNRAALLDSQADLLAQAAEIPFYVTRG